MLEKIANTQEKVGAIAASIQPPPIVPIREWPKYFGFPRIGTIKYLCLRRKENGFDRCVRMINKRTYLVVDKALEYFKEGE